MAFSIRSNNRRCKTCRNKTCSTNQTMTRVAKLGASVLEIGHRRAFADVTVGDVEIVMHLETRGREHVEDIIRAFESEGLKVEEYV